MQAGTARLVRRFHRDDIPAIADLHRRTFHTADATSPALVREYETYFDEVFLRNPFVNPWASPLVYAPEDSRPTGFLGMVPRPMRWNGKPILVATTSQFMIDPAARGQAGVALLRAAFEGPQHLLVADEANADSKTVWVALGGTAVLAQSMSWICPLRPARFLLWSTAKVASPLAGLVRMAAPAASLADFVARALGVTAYRTRDVTGEGEELDSRGIADSLSTLDSRRRLVPAYDSRHVDWLLQRAARLRPGGTVHAVRVRLARGRDLGWYVYRLSRNYPSQVLQFCAVTNGAEALLSHLAEHAWRRGAFALFGRAEPALADALFRMRWPLLYGPHWMLAHSRDRAILAAFERGETLFSRLEGEFCLHFR